MLKSIYWMCLVSMVLATADCLEAADFKVQQRDQAIEITQAGDPVATYHVRSGAKPVLWPVYGPGGVEMTRAYPMRDAKEGERSDHIHHRSLWLTHGEVNGVDFWAETKDHGVIEQTKMKFESGKTAVIETENDWKAADGTKILSDRRRLTFGGDDAMRWIDCDFTLVASAGEVHFGDTKEGSFGVRVAGTMKVDAKQGGVIVNSEGQTDKAAWGKTAKWVDYCGPVEGETRGIAIFNHPSSFHYPCRWHVRTYGLFAANPFGHYHFVGQKEKTDGVRLAAGESMKLRYRVVLHRGSTEEAQIEKHFAEYAKESIEGP